MANSEVFYDIMHRGKFKPKPKQQLSFLHDCDKNKLFFGFGLNVAQYYTF